MTLANHHGHDTFDRLGAIAPMRPLEDRQPLVGLLAGTLDLAMLVSIGVATSLIYHLAAYGHGATGSAIAFVLLVSTVMILLRSVRGDYSASALMRRNWFTPALLSDWLASIALFVALSFLIGDAGANSRGVMLLFGIAGFGVLWSRRKLTQLLVNQSVKTGKVAIRRAVLVGAREHLVDYYQHERIWQRGISVAASVVVPDQGDAVSIWLSNTQTERANVPLSKLAEGLRGLHVDDIVLVIPWSQAAGMQTLLDELSKLPATIHLAPDAGLNTIRLGPFGPVDLSSVLLDPESGLPGIRLSRRPLAPFDRLAKRIFDVVAAALGLICLAPFFVLLMIAISLESNGPPIFRQARNGFNERPFHIYKFRSMRSAPQGNFQQTQRNDARITRIGRLIRRTNIDELPQLLNVLLGDMSLVGPRPHALEHNHAFMTLLGNYARRHHVKPGITGWAQVNGARGAAEDEASMSLRLRFDLVYIQNWSFRLDLRILLLTVASRKAFRNAF